MGNNTERRILTISSMDTALIWKALEQLIEQTSDPVEKCEAQTLLARMRNYSYKQERERTSQ